MRHRFVERVLSRAEGLPDVVARSIAQDRDGFLWIGTFDGLARWDGHAMRVWHARDDAALVEDAFVALHFDQTDRMWASGMHSLRRRDESGWIQIELPAALRDAPITSFAEPRDGSLWFAANRQIGCINADDRVVPIEPPARAAGDRSGWSIAVDSVGRLHVRCETLFARRDQDAWTKLIELPVGGERVRGIASSPRGGIWCVVGHHARRFEEGRVVEERSVPPEIGYEASAVLEDRDSGLWIGSFYFGLAWLPKNGEPSVVTHGEGLPNSNIRWLFEDREGVVHVGTSGGGLVSFTPRRVRERALGRRSSDENAVLCTAQSHDDTVLVSTIAGGLWEVAAERSRWIANTHDALGRDQLTALLVVADGSRLLGTRTRGLWLLKDGALSRLLSVDETGTAVGALQEREGALWWVSSRGVVRFTADTLSCEAFAIDGSHEGTTAHDLNAAPNGELWVAGEAGLGRIHGARIESVTIELDGRFLSTPSVRTVRPLGDDLVMVVLVGPAPRIAIGCFDRDRRILRARTLLCDVAVSELLLAGDVVWLNGDDALRRFDLAELRAFAQNGGTLPHPLRLDGSDGLPSPLTYGSEPRRACLDDAGRAWFATPTGVCWVEPGTVTPIDCAPTVMLDRCFADGRELPCAADVIVVPAGTRDVRVVFVAPALRGADRVALAYREEGAANGSPVGADLSLDFRSLALGMHRFEVRASNPDGVWSEDVTVVEFELEPRFSETSLARLFGGSATVMLVALLLWMRHRASVERTRQRLDAAERLAAACARADLLLGATDELVCFADGDGRITALNDSGQVLLGCRGCPPLGTLLESLLVPSLREAFAGIIRPAADASGRWSGEIRLLAADGREIPVVGSLLVHRQADGQIDFVSLVVRDRTDRVATEEQAVALERQLRQAQKLEALGTLAGGIAHDFNNLLTAILGHAELAALMLEKRADTAAARDSVAEILHASERGRELVRRLMQFGRRGEQRRSVARLAPIVDEACRLLRSTIPGGADFVVEIEDADATARIDTTAIHQLLINLCTNSAHALSKGRGCITVQLARVEVGDVEARAVAGLRPGRFVRLTIADDGAGMTPEVLARAFEPFFTTKDPGEGTGLGLATVHGIVTSHDGAIAIASAPGAGSRVDIWLPEVTPVVESAAAEPEPPAHGNGEHLLLVEDDPAVRALGQRSLELLGYRVTAMERPADAIARVDAEPNAFAAVVSDYSMPDWTGIQLARRLHSVVPDLPVVLVTACLNGAKAEDLLELGICEVLEKPYEQRELAAALRRALEERSEPSPLVTV